MSPISKVLVGALVAIGAVHAIPMANMPAPTTTTGMVDPTTTATGMADPTNTATGMADPTNTATGMADPMATDTGMPDPTDTDTGMLDPTDTDIGMLDPTGTDTGMLDPTGTATDIINPTDTGTPDSSGNTPSGNTGGNDELIAQLLTKSTAVKKFQLLLTQDGKLADKQTLTDRTVFNFNDAAPAKGAKGGATKAANIDTFPILTDLGISVTMGFLEPCGINTPHVHPRATEFLTVVDGAIDFGYILENGLVTDGSSEVTGSLTQFQGTVFPMGSIHYQINTKCKGATFVAALNSEDPGTSQVAQNFFGLNAGVVDATLGFPKSLNGKDIESFRKDIPANIAQAIDTCLASCPK